MTALASRRALGSAGTFLIALPRRFRGVVVLIRRLVLVRIGAADVVVERVARALRVDVEDNGPGVPDEMRASLFLPLVTSRAEGTGLGLAICRNIVEAHQGTITAGPSPYHGLQIKIEIPLAK